MELTKRQLIVAQQALGYAVMFAKTANETTEFAILKIQIESSIRQKMEADEKYGSLNGCPFNYCDSEPKCKDKCRHNKTISID